MGEVDELNCLELLFSTSRPAIADWPRDASCLSVASIRRVQVPLKIYRCVQLKCVLFSAFRRGRPC